ncbi:MAG: ZIP family metal transporter [Candidatus Dormibacteraeota bacterium]|nr:ZIP family metal transporter [Candidatus Dormibacteraeota bacterium]
MNATTVTLLGALAGLTIFLGLPVARARRLNRPTQGFLNALATGVLIFLLVDILSHAAGPLEESLGGLHRGQALPFAVLAPAYGLGLAAGLLGLTWVNRRIGQRLNDRILRGPGAAVAAASPAAHSARILALSIAVGLGLHNFSEGLAIGQSAAQGAYRFFLLLVIGFGLHNITEGFGIAAPLAGATEPPSWAFLITAGLIGGGPTFLGTVIGYHVVSPYAYVLFLTLAGGALIYVLNEMLGVCKRLNGPMPLAAGLLAGFLAAAATDLLLVFVGG